MPGKKIIISNNQEETIKIAYNIASKLSGGEVIALSGDLGSGKTTFAKGIAEALHVKEKITSPTFVLLKMYSAHLPKMASNIKYLIHADCYRLKKVHDIESIGLEEYLHDINCVCVIEWAEKIKKFLGRDVIKIKFIHTSKNKRKIIIKDKNDTCN